MKTPGLLLSLALAAAPAHPESLAIVGGTIWTGGPQGTIPNGTLVIRDGKIVAVGAGLRAPDGARVIEAGGRFVMPGIIDEHSHAAIEGDVNECTDIVTAEVRVGDVIDHRDPGIYRQLAGGVTTIHSLHGSCNAIGGQNAILKLRWGQGPDELLFEGAPRSIKFALGENPKRANARGRERRYPATRMGVEAVLRQHFEAARAYAREWQDYEKRARAAGAQGPAPVPPRRDLRLETLRDVLAGKVQVHAHCYRADEILMLIRLADEFGFKIRTFEHVLEGYKVASEIARHGAGASTFIDWWGFKLEAYDAVPYNPAVLQSRGVLVSLNSDSGELARRLYWDAAKAVKYGVSEDEALRMITINPARQLGIDRRVGSLEVGKDADVAIFSTHPFSPDARPEMTLVDGTVYFDRAADLARRPATPAPAAAPSQARAQARTDAQAPPSGTETVALVGGRIVPVSGPALARGTVVISGGRIVAVGADVAPPAGARVIDVAGQTVYPGLIDASNSIGLVEIGAVPASVDTTETGDVNPQAQAWVALNPHSEAIPVARANGVTTALAAPRGGLVSGQSAVVRLAGTTPDEMTLLTPAALQVVFPSGEPEREWGGEEPEPKTLEARLEERRKGQDKQLRRLAGLLAEARAHAAARQAASAGQAPAPAPDVVLEALAPAAQGRLPVMVRAEREADIRAAVAFAQEQGLRLIVSGGLEAWRCADLLREKDVPVLLSVLRLPARESDPYDAAYANAARLQAAGVRFAIVTDSPTDARSLPYHAAMARAFGLTADQALRAITQAPAEILGLGARLGSLEPGKDADVVVASGDIMDIRTQVTRVFVAGREQPLETRHTRLWERFKARP